MVIVFASWSTKVLIQVTHQVTLVNLSPSSHVHKSSLLEKIPISPNKQCFLCNRRIKHIYFSKIAYQNNLNEDELKNEKEP